MINAKMRFYEDELVVAYFQSIGSMSYDPIKCTSHGQTYAMLHHHFAVCQPKSQIRLTVRLC